VQAAGGEGDADGAILKCRVPSAQCPVPSERGFKNPLEEGLLDCLRRLLSKLVRGRRVLSQLFYGRLLPPSTRPSQSSGSISACTILQGPSIDNHPASSNTFSHR